jgi:hypothetical protein
MRTSFSYETAIELTLNQFQAHAQLLPPSYWQSVDVSSKPEMATYEVRNVAFTVQQDDFSLSTLRRQINPNLPWADDHFAERVCGEPINPGLEWKRWPYGHSADRFRDGDGRFNHNYMERYWPRYANIVGYSETAEDVRRSGHISEVVNAHRGLRHEFGDLDDVVQLFVRDPLTRQAFVPIFFPEDTGVRHGGRVPCTLGYHFIRRGQQLHVVYYIRSCDLLRHFRDDIYLTVRLNLWMLEQLAQVDKDNWIDVIPGEFTMIITSLHCFRNDWFTLFGEPGPTDRGSYELSHRPKARPSVDEAR